MLLGFLTVCIMIIVTMAFYNEDLLTAFGMTVNVFLAGLIAFTYYEPLAAQLGAMVDKTGIQGYEDAICLLGIFCPVLALFRLVLNHLSGLSIEYPLALLKTGTIGSGLVTGYLLSGFLICVFQTLPWHQNFMYFTPAYEPKAAGAAFRRVLPPDRVWLALVHRSGRYALGDGDSPETFDQYGNYEQRYARFRRYNDKGEYTPYSGEFAPELVNKAEQQ